ncbi:hypothetical protein C8Q76DRAFT_490622 [Earliella scabrosa]|nr:hypothetical protein C8Q76DRAFT_490622 [Earliella scabrosa]
MNRSRLNTDIWHLVLSYADRHTVSQTMKTCRFLNRDGVKYLLRDGVVLSQMLQPRSIDSFLAFMIGPRIQRVEDIMRYRFQFLRSLSICFFSVRISASVETVWRITRFFVVCKQYATNLTRLKISDAEPLMHLDEELPGAIAALTSLTHLEVRDVGDHTSHMLSALCSELVSATISLLVERDSQQDAPGPTYKTPTFLLKPSTTLRNLALSYSGSSEFTRRPIAPNRPPVPALEHVHMFDTHHLACAFPCLQTLTAKDCTSLGAGESEDWEDQRRALNVAKQTQHGSWPSLRLFKGTIRALYILGICCPVAHLRLWDEEDDFSELRMLAAIFRDTTPSRLNLYMPSARLIFDEELAAAFIQPSTEQLDSFELYLSIKDYDLGLDVDLVLAVYGH